ncbi:hypothetical protein ACLOJK_013696 [Asimina triloba]
MVIYAKGIPQSNGEMTIDNFKAWLKRFDINGDGRISRDELQKAIHTAGVWFSWLKSAQALKQADANHNGFIEDDEIENLVAFAHKSLGMKIMVY